MSSKKSLLILSSLIALFLAAIVGLNLAVDPYCFLCKEIDANQKTRNRRYQIAQIILRNPDAEQIILGSSRGESTSPHWLQQVSGLKTLNLSYPAAGIVTKTSFIDFALKHAQIKKVIWYADYFELTKTFVDGDVYKTKALRPYIQDIFSSSTFDQSSEILKSLIDWDTIRASFRASRYHLPPSSDLGEGSELDYTDCAKPGFTSQVSRRGLSNEIDILYDRYVRGIINKPPANEAKEAFKNLVAKLQNQHVELEIVILPYHPQFIARLKVEHPDIYTNHMEWISWLGQIKGPGVRVVNFFEGIPHDDQSSKFWVDGVHFTCKGVIEMMGSLDQNLPK
ncbi:hypothetical protein [Bdellovibrio svalbardensis]|uniref:Uncharacterized protein n=1 Tax=Bdellovibrio svalbardensis TaxID=2972972 RepID=A0ABT6DIA1_9BACT|nr:hypothetical protein [Bdellovibrio svalbardensis]MDG0816577.1 hypothetical protein [Bdellovibrio svalbardensis]